MEDPDSPLSEMLKSHTNSVNAVTLSPNGKLAASASLDGTVWLRDLATRTLRGMLKGHSLLVNAVTFSPGSNLVASALDDGTVRL